MEKLEIGIIGCGVVGTALHQGLIDKGVTDRFVLYDPKTHPEAVSFSGCDYVFICVPTPAYAINGGQNVSAVIDALYTLEEAGRYTGVVVLKSTITPTHVNKLKSKFPHLRLVTNPEFLTERTAVEDFKQQPFIVVGGNEDDVMPLVALYRRHWINSDIRWLPSASGAMMVKYLLNCFFAVKVAFLNEGYKLWEEIGDVPWEYIVGSFRADARLSKTHTQVPGPDGKFGFGGKCFPKDLAALIAVACDAGTPCHVMEGAQLTNKAVR